MAININYFVLPHNCGVTQQDGNPDKWLSPSRQRRLCHCYVHIHRMWKDGQATCENTKQVSTASLIFPQVTWSPTKVIPLLALHNVSNRASMVNEQAAIFHSCFGKCLIQMPQLPSVGWQLWVASLMFCLVVILQIRSLHVFIGMIDYHHSQQLPLIFIIFKDWY